MSHKRSSANGHCPWFSLKQNRKNEKMQRSRLSYVLVYMHTVKSKPLYIYTLFIVAGSC